MEQVGIAVLVMLGCLVVVKMNSELRPEYTEEELKDRQSKGYNTEVNLF